MKSICTARSRCNDHKSCHRCSRIRQAKIADHVTARLARNHYLSIVIIKIDKPETLKPNFERLKRSVRDISSGGVWTVEAGEMLRGLHINMLIASERPLKISKIRKVWGDLGQVWYEPVFDWREYWREFSKEIQQPEGKVFKDDLIGYFSRNESETIDQFEESDQKARSIAAYISKQAGMPTDQEYPGRIYGAWGSAQGPKPISEYLISKKQSPIVAGTAIADRLGFEQPRSEKHLKEIMIEMKESGVIDKYIYLPGSGIVPRDSLPPNLEITTNPDGSEFVKNNGKKLVRDIQRPKGIWIKKEKEKEPSKDDQIAQIAKIRALLNP